VRPGQRLERRREHPARQHRVELVLAGRVGQGGQLPGQLDRAGGAAAQPVDGDVVGDPEQPAPPVLRSGEADEQVDVPPGPQERLLDDVLGAARVARQQPGHVAAQRRAVGADELVDEVVPPVHLDPLGGRGRDRHGQSLRRVSVGNGGRADARSGYGHADVHGPFWAEFARLSTNVHPRSRAAGIH